MPFKAGLTVNTLKENRMDNQEWTIQKQRQHRHNYTKTNKTPHITTKKTSNKDPTIETNIFHLSFRMSSDFLLCLHRNNGGICCY